MARVVLADGSMMHVEANAVSVVDGHLMFGQSGNSGAIAAFAPGTWRYYLWVVAASA